MNKRGILISNVVFISVVLLFFVLILGFIYSNARGRPVYEQKLAKQIALMIDEAKPEMDILINVEKELEIAEKNNQDKEKIVAIDEKEKKVIVKLGYSGGGYSYNYFPNYKISTKFKGTYLWVRVE